MNDRQTGRTTQQMKAAPNGAVFIWCNSSVEYPKRLAKAIGRDDLIVRPLSWLERHNAEGRKLVGLVLDHATPILSTSGYEALMYVRKKGVPEAR